jgi:uncharacterized RDD family membrane protein YckC
LTTIKISATLGLRTGLPHVRSSMPAGVREARRKGMNSMSERAPSHIHGQSANVAPQQGVQPYHPAHLPHSVAVPYAGPALVPAGGRLGAMLLDGLLMVVTLWFGWLVWSMFTWSDGQTPAKKLLGHVVADPGNGAPFDWGRMAMREFVIKGLLGWILNVCTLGIYFWVDAFTCFGDRQRTLHDRMANSIVRYL